MLRIRKQRNRINPFIFLYIIYLIDSILSESRYVEITAINTALIVFRYISLLGLAVMAFIKQQKINRKWFIVGSISISAATITTLFFHGGISILFIIFIALASERVPISKIVKTTLLCVVLTYLFVIISSYAGIIQDAVGVRYVGSSAYLSGEYIRHSLGFMVSNQVPSTFFTMYLLYISMKKEEIPIWINISVALLNYLIFKMCGSRLIFLVMYIAIATYYLIRILDKLKRRRAYLFEKVMSYSFIVFALASFYLSYTYNSSSTIYRFIDGLLNHRISMSNESLNYYGIGLIGNGRLAGTYYGELSTVTVDNGYISLFIQNGLIIGVIILVLWVLLARQSIHLENRYVYWSIFFISFINLINSDMISYRVAVWYCFMIAQYSKTSKYSLSFSNNFMISRR